MSVIRINKTKDYTIMSNYHFKEKEMSLKAKGLLSLMLSLPDAWDYSVEGLVAICKENETAINSTLKELKEFGYLVITKLLPNQTDSGRIEYIYDIYERPFEKQEGEKQEGEKQEGEKQEGGKQDLENLGVEILGVENQGQLNTNNIYNINNIYNTNNKNTNNNIKEKEIKEKENIIEIINYLNQKTHKQYRYTTSKTQTLIKARFKEGFNIDDFKKVIDIKSSQWLGTEWEQYLRPETLFGTKFENYLNQNGTIKNRPDWYSDYLDEVKNEKNRKNKNNKNLSQDDMNKIFNDFENI